MKLCNFIGHDMRFNFPSMPSKAICTRCKSKWRVNWNTLDFKKVYKFEGDDRNDKELIEKWYKRK